MCAPPQQELWLPSGNVIESLYNPPSHGVYTKCNAQLCSAASVGSNHRATTYPSFPRNTDFPFHKVHSSIGSLCRFRKKSLKDKPPRVNESFKRWVQNVAVVHSGRDKRSTCEQEQQNNTYKGMILSPLLAFFSQARSANSRHEWLQGWITRCTTCVQHASVLTVFVLCQQLNQVSLGFVQLVTTSE